MNIPNIKIRREKWWPLIHTWTWECEKCGHGGEHIKQENAERKAAHHWITHHGDER